jgi:hypothetical protein
MTDTLAPSAAADGDDHNWSFATNDDIDNMMVFGERGGDDDDESLQDKWGMKFEAPFFCGFIIFAAIFVLVLVKCSRRQERSRDTRRKGTLLCNDLLYCILGEPFLSDHFLISYFVTGSTRTEKTSESYEKLKELLEAKPYSPEYKEALDAAEDSKTVVEVCDYPTDTSYSHSATSSGNNDEEEGIHQHSTRSFANDDSQCVICKQSLVLGQPVYQSNNPLCCHHQHQACMDKWLEYQNSCPTCNQPFLVQPPTLDA